MRGWTLVGAMALGVATAAQAQYSVVEALAGSVYDRVGICNGRLQGTSNEVQIRAKRLTSLLGSAEALYSSQYNKVLVQGDFFTGDRIKTLPEIAGGGQYYGAFNVVSTIYHELGHAEWDVFIEEDETPQDKAFYDLVEEEIVPWIRRTQGHVDKPWLAVQEWHGYFRGKLVNVMLTDWNELLFWNGIDPRSMQIDERMAAGFVRDGKIPPEDFGTLSAAALPGGGAANLRRPYLARIRGYDFMVTNGLIDGQVAVDTSTWTAAEGFEDAWWQAIWDHTDHFYCLHDDMDSLRRRIEATLGEATLARLREIQVAAHAAAQPAAPSPGGAGGGLLGLPGGE